MAYSRNSVGSSRSFIGSWNSDFRIEASLRAAWIIYRICGARILRMPVLSYRIRKRKTIKAKPNFTKKIVEKCINKGYLLGYTLDGDKLVGSSSN